MLYLSSSTNVRLLVCGNGGTEYFCSPGSFKSGFTCPGTTTEDIQTCTGKHPHSTHMQKKKQKF